ncbi:DUF7311 family protein [Halostella litorea]|uniref:DUF7311 family protein n=1 Tax=Halostella litorea TaxID=2528831 RepID=UPI001092D685|nr:hypothetical protein [Halostella litorea]
MTVRVVLAVLLATALVAASLPAVDDGRERATDSQVRGEIDRIERTAASLLATEETVPGASNGPRRSVTVSLPERSWHRAGVDELTIREPTEGSSRSRVAYAVAGRDRRVVTLDAPVRPAAGPLELSGGGDYQLRLRLVRVDGEQTVVVDRPGV